MFSHSMRQSRTSERAVAAGQLHPTKSLLHSHKRRICHSHIKPPALVSARVAGDHNNMETSNSNKKAFSIFVHK
jgi:anti-sigma factor ChrR (cupin superfamily)